MLFVDNDGIIETEYIHNVYNVYNHEGLDVSIIDVIDNYAINICKLAALRKPTAHECYVYAKSILEDRFELGEDIIATSARYSYMYAKYILKGRFELGEEVIKTDVKVFELYNKFLDSL